MGYKAERRWSIMRRHAVRDVVCDGDPQDRPRRTAAPRPLATSNHRHGPSARSLSACTPRVIAVMQVKFLSLPSILMPQLMRPLRNARP